MRMRCLIIIGILLCVFSFSVPAITQCDSNDANCTDSFQMTDTVNSWVELSGLKNVTLPPGQTGSIRLNGVCFATDFPSERIKVTSDTGQYNGDKFKIGVSGEFYFGMYYKASVIDPPIFVTPGSWKDTNGHYNNPNCTDAGGDMGYFEFYVTNPPSVGDTITLTIQAEGY